ncbi:S8 family serine peptidase [Calditrichota bacterium LG25]
MLKCSDIGKVTLNYKGVLCSIPNDPYWNEQWALQKIGVDLAWDVIKPDNTILVGIIDSGIDYNHEDLVDNIWHNPDEIPNNNTDDDNNEYIDDVIGYDFQSNDNDPYDIGITKYHGTRVSGVISARTFNSMGISGIAGGWANMSGVRLIGLKIVNPSTGTWDQYHAYRAIIYLAALKGKGNTVVANMSIANYFNSDEELSLFKSGIEEAKNAGVIMIAASGNADPNNPNPKYRTYPEVDQLPAPARWDGVLAIGASKDGSTLNEEKRSVYSMYDIPDNPFADAKLLIVAPVDTNVNLSINIKTSYPLEPYYIDWFNGTSAACPYPSCEVHLS